MLSRRRQRGMTLLELLVVVGIIGVLAALAIWNYFIAINRAKQKRTMADMRSIAMSWEIYAQDNQSYTPAAAVFDFPTTPIDSDDLHAILAPKYMKSFPKKDGWGNPYDFAVQLDDPNNPSTFRYYAIRSKGADGLADPSYEASVTDDFKNDIVYSNGSFVVVPKQKQ